MLRSGTCVRLFAAFTFVSFVTAEYTVYNNGWIPVSPDKVYNQIRREFVHPLNYHRSVYKDDIKLLNDTSSSLVHRRSEMDDSKDTFNNGKLVWIELDEQNKLGPLTFQKKTSGFDQDAMYNKETIRKAKKIAEYVVNEEVIDIKDEAEGETNSKMSPQPGGDHVQSNNLTKNNLNTIADESTNIYEVTEDPKLDYISSQNYPKQNIEYQYNSPETRNLTSKFFDILSKYNIKPNDKLNNYEVSRVNKDQITTKRNYRVPVRIPYTYNNPNHMPIDPLFAVFLSNYGVYLPGIYGINSNYNNIYGYLASNNIHNNKPFGSYKVYSDTDSSN